MHISSSPENSTLPIGASITLNCTAQPTARDIGYRDRWVKYIEWYDPQDNKVVAKCEQPSEKRKKSLSCPLVLKNLSVDKFGRYTCQAGNAYVKHCTSKSFEIMIRGKQTRLIIPLINNYSTRACWISDDRWPTRLIIIWYPTSVNGIIFCTLYMKEQVLHRERAYLKVLGWSLV